MYLAIEFTDGSNPWVKFRIPDKKTMNREVKKWEKAGYYLWCVHEDEYGAMCRATYYGK